MSINLPEDAAALYHIFEKQLLEDVLLFWIRHSIDEEHGGFFTCLDQEGIVFDTDKFIWLQCRLVWTFAKFFNVISQIEKWLKVAVHCADFLEEKGRDERGSLYFSLDRAGRPLIQPYNIFSDCFWAMEFAQLHVATGGERYKKIDADT